MSQLQTPCFQSNTRLRESTRQSARQKALCRVCAALYSMGSAGPVTDTSTAGQVQLLSPPSPYSDSRGLPSHIAHLLHPLDDTERLCTFFDSCCSARRAASAASTATATAAACRAASSSALGCGSASSSSFSSAHDNDVKYLEHGAARSPLRFLFGALLFSRCLLPSKCPGPRPCCIVHGAAHLLAQTGTCRCRVESQARTCDVLVVVLLFELEPQLLVDLLEVRLQVCAVVPVSKNTAGLSRTPAWSRLPHAGVYSPRVSNIVAGPPVPQASIWCPPVAHVHVDLGSRTRRSSACWMLCTHHHTHRRTFI